MSAIVPSTRGDVTLLSVIAWFGVSFFAVLDAGQLRQLQHRGADATRAPVDQYPLSGLSLHGAMQHLKLYTQHSTPQRSGQRWHQASPSYMPIPTRRAAECGIIVA